MNRNLFLYAGALCAGLFVAACSGGGSDSVSSGFIMDSTSLTDGQEWEINKPIVFGFSADVDFSTVNQNTITIRREGGAPAPGTFSLTNARTVVFQPACPTQSDFSDAGFQPGGLRYEVILRGSDSVATVQSTTGQPLGTEQTLHLVTPVSTLDTVLFIDPVAGPPRAIISPTGSYLQEGGGADVALRTYFQPRPVPDAELGATTPANYKAPLNLYSDVRTRIEIVVVVDQPVSVAANNISPDTVTLEYDLQTGNPTTWASLPHDVTLVANCTETGAVLRVTPSGILPPGREVRVRLTPQFRDIVGSGNIVPIAVASFTIAEPLDPGTQTPGDGADEFLEEFNIGGPSVLSLEDTTVAFADPKATWTGGKLTAAFAFDGTGGPPAGNFDLEIGDSSGGAIEVVTVDTTFAQITNSEQSAVQTVVNGRIDIRNLKIWPNGQLNIQGINPCRILASGTVDIEGKVLIQGSSSRGVTSFNTAQFPDPGAAGQGGGGRGGQGSPLTNQSDPKGQEGFGAFDVPGGGGGGGESAWCTGSIGCRRPGGGGGGVFGKDVLRPAPNLNDCPEQTVIGLDVETGFNGSPQPPPVGQTSGSASLGAGFQAIGGSAGPGPFADADAQGVPITRNDFWGTMFTQTGALILGELPQPWAGAGGGGGGDSVQVLANAASFPQVPYDVNNIQKGSGGGGGGGSLTIFALGSIKISGYGSIDASGGTGNGGESTNGINRVGGGSGGGSGGHIILMTGSQIDLTQLSLPAGEALYPNPQAGGLYALGGQGGEGAGGNGGAGVGNGGSASTVTTPQFDALPPNHYPNSTPATALDGPCKFSTNIVGNANPVVVVPGTGGDGGPGLIQLHAPTLADILPPIGTSGNADMFKCVKPNPIGSTVANVNTPTAWDQLLPVFSRNSKAQSKWISLGSATVQATGSTPDPVEFVFGGTDTDGVGDQGFVLTTGAGASRTVAPLTSVFAPAGGQVLASAPALPFIAADQRTIVFDRTTLTDDIYARNPSLMRRFEVRMTQGAVVKTFEVAVASLGTGNELRVTVAGSGTPLFGLGAGTNVVVRPRFFRVITRSPPVVAAVPDSLPESSTIKVEFQAAPATSNGDPDEVVGNTHASDWETDINELNTHPNAAKFKFVRFRVAFDIVATGGQLGFDTPIPSLEFFRIPFRF
ncbi:MAG: hypothetical protein ACKVWV_07950 [Planctomycetota bacterium]